MCDSMQILLSTRQDYIKSSHIEEGAISNVQKHMKKCHSVEIKAQSTAQYEKAMESNKKQRTLDCSFSMKEQKHMQFCFQKDCVLIHQ